MSFTLYLRDDCHDCRTVIAWLDKARVPYTVADIDRDRLPGDLRLFAAPALCKDGRLVAYGVDIVRRLQDLGYGV